MGICLYEMLTGVLPFRGPDFLAMLADSTEFLRQLKEL